MSIPVSRVEVWQGGAKLYTWDDVATQIHVKEVLNGVGTFNVTVPVKPDNSYLYTDVALNDTVKIFLDWDTIPATPLTIGKICKITGTDAGGYQRTFEGKNQAEVLERRLKDDYFFALNASDLVTELANDLTLGVGDIDATVAKNETLAFDAEPYFAALKKASDYYVDATNVKKDFYVDVDNHLNWKARPIRTFGVETLTAGENEVVCSVYRDILPVKNNIIVYGRKNRPEPSTWDACEATTNWTKEDGFSHGTDAADYKVGTVSYTAQSPLEATPRVIVYYSPPNQVYGGSLRNGFDSIHFWVKVTGVGAAPDVWRSLELYTDVAGGHYFARDLADPWGRSTYVFGEWNEYDFAIGPGYLANGWTAGGGSTDNDWNNDVERIRFDFASSGNGTMVVRIDGLYFYSQRWYCATQNNPASIASYGQRDLIYIDDRCVSDADALARAQVMLYLLKDPPTRIDVTTKGNTNIRIGDRLSMTVPAENITASNFDVLTVEHDLIKDLGFTTKASMLSASDMRQLPVATAQEGFLRKFEGMNELGRGFEVHK